MKDTAKATLKGVMKHLAGVHVVSESNREPQLGQIIT